MKRNLDATKLLLQSTVGASIDYDKVLQRFGEIQTAVVKIEGERDDINELLRFVGEVTDDFRKKREVMDKLREKAETIIWKRQVISPHLKYPIDELEISDAAAALIPPGVETFGQLVQYHQSELGPSADPYVNEIKDALRFPHALVLNPKIGPQ